MWPSWPRAWLLRAVGEVDLRVIGSAASSSKTTQCEGETGPAISQQRETGNVMLGSSPRQATLAGRVCTGGFPALGLTNGPAPRPLSSGRIRELFERSKIMRLASTRRRSRSTERSANPSPMPWPRARGRNQARPSRSPPPALPDPAEEVSRNRSERPTLLSRAAARPSLGIFFFRPIAKLSSSSRPRWRLTSCANVWPDVSRRPQPVFRF